MQMNGFNSCSKFEMSDKHCKLLAIMKEFGIIQGGHVPYREAVKIYYEWLHSMSKPFEPRLFGDYSLRVKDYEIITKQEFDIIWDIFRSYKPKKLFSGVKMYCPTLPTDELYRKEKVSFVKPGDILWETTGLDINSVRQMARQATVASGVEIEVYDTRGVNMTQ